MTVYQRTTRRYPDVRHLFWRDTGEKLCKGLPDYTPEPTVFHPGQEKPDKVEIGCPQCRAVAVLCEITETHPDLVADFAHNRQTK